MISILYQIFSKVLFKYQCYMQNIEINYIEHICGFIYLRNKGKAKFGNEIKINAGSRCNRISGETKCAFIIKENGVLIIGNNVGISNSTIVCTKKITIEDNVLIGSNCKIWDTQFHNLDYDVRINGQDTPKQEEITIEEGAFIGYGTIILPGVRVGNKAIIGAGSVVTKSIPPNEVWAGNPAKKIR